MTYPLKHLHYVTELQFIQDSPDSLMLKYVSRPEASAEMVATELQGVELGLRRLMGRSTTLKTMQVEEISRGPTGKFKWIISQLDPTTIGRDLKRQK